MRKDAPSVLTLFSASGEIRWVQRSQILNCHLQDFSLLQFPRVLQKYKNVLRYYTFYSKNHHIPELSTKYSYNISLIQNIHARIYQPVWPVPLEPFSLVRLGNDWCDLVSFSQWLCERLEFAVKIEREHMRTRRTFNTPGLQRTLGD